jgi:hypothetical protein
VAGRRTATTLESSAQQRIQRASPWPATGSASHALVTRHIEKGVNREACVSLDANTGREELWVAPLAVSNTTEAATARSGNDGGDGPQRSTQRASDDAACFTHLSSQLVLFCLDARTAASCGARVGEARRGGISWQNAASPLVEET